MKQRTKKPFNPNTYTPKERNLYLMGMIGQNMIYNIINTGLVFYLSNVIFIPQWATGIIFTVARVWDAINDPMMGTICDHTRSKWGKCRPYLIFVPGVVMITTILTFVNIQYTDATTPAGQTLVIAWAGIAYVLWGMSYTAGDIPLWGITALMTDDEKDRANLLSLARIAAGLGGAVVLLSIVPVSQALGEALTEAVGDVSTATQYGFIIVAVVLTVISTVLFLCAGAAKERVPQSERHYTLKENFMTMWKNKPFRKLLISAVLRSPFQLLTLVAMNLLSYYYGNFSRDSYIVQMIFLGGAIFGGQFLAMAFAPALAAKYEKKRVFNLSNVISGVPFALIFVVYLMAPQSLDQWGWMGVLFVLFLLAGAGTGVVNVLQSVMIADCIDYEEYTTGMRPDGVFFSGQSFATKLGGGVSAILQSVVFTAVGFSDAVIKEVNETLIANPTMTFKADYAEYSMAMFFLVSIPPAIGCLLSIIPTWKYPLTNKEHARILEFLRIRRTVAEEKGVDVGAVTEAEVIEAAEKSGISLDPSGESVASTTARSQIYRD